MSTLVIILLGLTLTGLHLWWRARFRNLEAEHHRAVQAMRERQEQLAAQTQAQQQALLNSMLEGVALLDAQGRVLMANQALEKLIGTGGSIEGKSVLEAFRLHGVAELAGQVIQQGQVMGFDLEIPGIEKRFVQINGAAILNGQGRPHGTILVFHDLTRIRQLENTRQEFVANVSHELRTPLSLIKGYVETLLGGARDDPEVANRFLQIIEKHADRLQFLIEDLLTISQLESGQAALNTSPLELRPLVERILEDFQSQAQEKRVRLRNAVPAGLSVSADAGRLQQVFSNLIDNAIKYGKTSGQATVAARPSGGQKVEIEVGDDGPGIPPESLDRVFERFYRVDRARSREQGGTGLGLSIVKHIVQSHGGEVWARSELGQGTTFFFTLPAPAPAPTGFAPQPAAP